MNKQDQNGHKFHLMIDTEMQKNLKDTALYKKLGNISRLIIRVLTLLSPGIEEKHAKNQQMASRYEFVHNDLNVKRKGVFIYLPEHQYRQLKLLHQDLNYYSMAQLMRLVMRVFLGLAKEFGDAVESKLLELYRIWKKKRDFRKHEWKPIEELLHFCFQKSAGF